MAAADYITVVVPVVSTVKRVEKTAQTSYLVPKSSLIEALGAKMDVDFAAQNAAVTNQTLDVNYGALVSDGV
jgi:hypothetical protein